MKEKMYGWRNGGNGGTLVEGHREGVNSIPVLDGPGVVEASVGLGVVVKEVSVVMCGYVWLLSRKSLWLCVVVVKEVSVVRCGCCQGNLCG